MAHRGVAPVVKRGLIGDGGNNLFLISVPGVKSDVSQSCAPGPSEMLMNYEGKQLYYGSFLSELLCPSPHNELVLWCKSDADEGIHPPTTCFCKHRLMVPAI